MTDKVEEEFERDYKKLANQSQTGASGRDGGAKAQGIADPKNVDEEVVKETLIRKLLAKAYDKGILKE